MKNVLVLSMGATLLLLSGCMMNQPDFDPSKTQKVTVKGKIYQIPQGAVVSPYVDNKVIDFYRKIGLQNCKQGDITWEEKSAHEAITTAIDKGDKSIYEKLAEEGRIGCASPLPAK